LIFAWIEGRKTEWPIVLMCRVLEVSRSGFYAWRSRDASAAAARREELTAEVKAIHARVKARYGSPRIHAEPAANGHACSVNFVAQVMREAGIAAKTKRKFKQTTDSNHTLPVAANVLDREFDPDQPNTRWCADITYIPTRGGWLYLAAVEDLFSRRIVGWSMDQTMTSRLVVDALEMALARRLKGSSAPALVAHSDRGSQYASEHYRRRLAEERIECSMSRGGDCWDNAAMESFFASLKTDPTTTSSRRRRCRARYNTSGDRLPVGSARTGTLVPGVPRPHSQRSHIMSGQPVRTPPRA
jgi:putative transposase